MFNFPFYNNPYRYPYYRNYNNPYNKHYTNHKNNNYINNSTIEPESETKPEPEVKTKKQQENSITNSNEISNTINTRFIPNITNDQAIFEILGIKLYLDDLIILGLLFFLYQEKVKDEMLYIILFLLLFA